MKKFIKLMILFSFLFLMSHEVFPQSDTLRITTYNILGFGSNSTHRIPYFRTVIHAIQPDILVVQEMINQQGVDCFLNEILNDEVNQYAAAPFINGFDTDNALFYRCTKFDLISVRQIPTALREISEYTLSYKNNNANMPYLKVYSCHLKASDGSTNEQKRYAEASILRNELNQLPANTNFFVCGDFNLYTADEPAFKILTVNQVNNENHCIFPKNSLGNWHENSYFADIHTQSTRTTQFDGGSPGGLDDCFDMIFVSSTLMDSYNYCYLAGSLTAYGNDGLHLNLDINHGVNYSIPDSIADALYYASDHLPVYLDVVVFDNTTEINQLAAQAPQEFSLGQNYPNPFNAETSIEYTLLKNGAVKLKVYDLLGQEVATLIDNFMPAGSYKIIWNGANLATGLYFYKLEFGSRVISKRMVLLK